MIDAAGTIRYRNPPSQSVTVIDSQTVTEKVETPTIVRQSTLLLFLKLSFLEILFAVLFFMLRVPGIILNFFVPYTPYANSLYSLLILLLIGIKIVFIYALTSSWMGEFYKIKRGEITHYIRGIFNDREEKFLLNNVETLEVKQSFLGRLLHYGSIELFSPVLNRKYTLSTIPNPSKYVEVIESVIPNYGNGERVKVLNQNEEQKYE